MFDTSGQQKVKMSQQWEDMLLFTAEDCCLCRPKLQKQELVSSADVITKQREWSHCGGGSPIKKSDILKVKLLS